MSYSSKLAFAKSPALSIIKHQTYKRNPATHSPRLQHIIQDQTNKLIIPLIHLVTSPHNPAISPRRPRQPSLNIPLHPPLHLSPHPLLLLPPSPLLSLKIRIITRPTSTPFIRRFTAPQYPFRNSDSRPRRSRGGRRRGGGC